MCIRKIRSKSRRMALLAALAFNAAYAAAQTSETTLTHLGAAAAEMSRALPSFGCFETGFTDELHGKSNKDRTDFTGNVRAIRNQDGTLTETIQLQSLEGKPFNGDRADLPFYVEGGFDRSLRYFAPEQQACYRYTVTPGRVDFEYNPASASLPGCFLNSGTRGFALLDAALNVTHVERQVDPRHRADPRLTPFASMDLTSVDLNGRTYRIPQHMLSITQRGSTSRRFDATFSNCKLFTATYTLSPIEHTNPEPQNPPSALPK